MGFNLNNVISGAAGAGLGFITGGAPGAVAGGIAGFGSSYGASQQNVSNAKEAKKNREYQTAEALKQRKFQERMSNTSHQRQIIDLKKAGLNPILSATSGASSPGGASGSGAQAQMVDAIGPAISSARASTRAKAEIELLNAQVGKTLQDASTAKSQEALLSMQYNKVNTENDLLLNAVPESQIMADFYRSDPGTVVKLLNTLGVSPSNALGVKKLFQGIKK